MQLKHIMEGALSIRPLFILLLSIVSFQVFSQSEKILKMPKFGEIDPIHLLMTTYEKDTAASAVILLDDGHLGREQGTGRFYLDYHTQVKILTAEGFNFADVSVPYERRSGLKNVEAAIHNLKNGEIVTRMIDKDMMMTQEVVDKERQLKIAFPDVAVGSIIEYSYTVYAESPFEFLPWYFQSKKAPVMLSTFSIKFTRSSELLKPRLYGYVGIDGYEQTSDNRVVLAMRDLPIFEEEAHVRNIKDHYSKVDYEYIDSYANDWPSLMQKMLKMKDLGATIKKLNTIKDIYPESKGWKADEPSLKDIHTYVANHFRWDRYISLTFTDKPAKVWETAEGNSADINLTLLMFLKKAGFQADPVFLSTSDHGMINRAYPTFSQFNNVVVRVFVEGKQILVDATSEHRPYNILPSYCLNDSGLVIRKGEPEWISMSVNKEKSVQSVSVDYEVRESGLITGSGVIRSPGVTGTSLRQDLINSYGDELEEGLQSRLDGLELSNVEHSGIEETYAPVSRSFDFTTSSFSDAIGGRVFLTPIVVKEIETNPFQPDSRKLLVEFLMQAHKRYVFGITIPEGYEIEEFPKSVKYVLPGGAGYYSYLSEKTENGLQIMVLFVIKKLVFNQLEYLNLREMFSLILAKQEERIVLKKKATD